MPVGLWDQPEIVGVEDVGQQGGVGWIRERSKIGRGQSSSRSVEDRHTEAFRIVARAVEQAVGLLWIPVEYERPALRREIAACAQAVVGAYPVQARAGQIDKPKGPTLDDLSEYPGCETCHGERSLPQLPSERLDECRLEVGGYIEGAILPRRSIKAIESAVAEVERPEPTRMTPYPGAIRFVKRQSLPMKIGRWVRVWFQRIHVRTWLVRRTRRRGCAPALFRRAGADPGVS